MGHGPAPGWDILVYPGQSNTVGHGSGSYVDTNPSMDNKIFQVGRASPNNLLAIPAVQPLQFWNNATSTLIGYGLSLARYYTFNYLAPTRSLIIVPAAHDTTSVMDWLGVGASDILYPDMATRINYCLGLRGEVNRIVGWFEQQGETDVVIAETPSDPRHNLMPDADAYVPYKEQLIDRFRGDFGSTIPMFFGGFADTFIANHAQAASFETAIGTAAAARTACYTVDTTGLPSSVGDSVHFSAAGQQTLAQRHFAAYQASL